MSKIKNTPEFQRMMDEQELMASFYYAEQEMAREQLFRDLAAEDAIAQATDEYIAAQKTFLEAMQKFQEALNVYKEYKGELHEEEEQLVDNTAMLRDMFAGFNPNAQ